MIRLVRLGRESVVLCGHLLRLLPWPHVLAAGAIAAVAATMMRPVASDPVAAMVDALRLAMVPLAIGVAFTLDDPVDRWLATPVPLSARRWVRVTAAVVAVVVLWAGVLTTTELIVGLPDGLPMLMLVMELATLIAITLAAAATGGRWLADRAGGTVAAATVLVVAGLQVVLPGAWSLFVPYRRPPQTDQQATDEWVTWVLAHQHWTWIAIAAVIVLAIASSDPARRSLRQLATAAPPSTT